MYLGDRVSFLIIIIIFALADLCCSSSVCKGCQLAKKKCVMTEEGLKEAEKKKAVCRGKKQARGDGSSDEVVEVTEVKGPQTA